MQLSPSYLVLENGIMFPGVAPAWQTADCYGEVVFTTGMTGYVESLTDPSYAGQILTFTYPLIGNYGVPARQRWESKRVQPWGVVVSETCQNFSQPQAERSLLEWLRAERVPIIMGLDTRALTKTLRERGVMLGVITPNPKLKPTFRDPNKENLLSSVSVGRKRVYGRGKKRVIAVDCGMKENIVRCLLQYPVTVVRVPHNYDYTTEPYDGLFLSNGPGDPARCKNTIAILKKALQIKKPIFGICLGSQLLALAAGAKTYKLPYGHRGHNQPCQELTTGRCVITSQNHGYAVNEKTVPKDWFVSFRNLNDGSVEGLAHAKLPYFSVQFHPEASPGPTDTRELFEKFFKMVRL